MGKRGLTIIVVTHEHDIAQYADRLVQFRDGRIHRDAPVENRRSAADVLKEMPADEEDAE